MPPLEPTILRDCHRHSLMPASRISSQAPTPGFLQQNRGGFFTPSRRHDAEDACFEAELGHVPGMSAIAYDDALGSRHSSVNDSASL